MSASLLGLMLILTRISGFLLVVPIFGWPAIPVRIKVSVAIVLSLFFCACKPLGVDAAQVSFPMAMFLLMGEALYGLTLGLVIALLFSVVQLSAYIAEQQMGLTMAEIVDPLQGEESGALANLMQMTFLLLFLNANGHHLFLQILSRSCDVFPPGTIPSLNMLVESVVSTGSVMFIASLRLAAPLLGAFLVLMIALALLARLVPEMDIFMVSIPARVALGLFLAAIFSPFLGGFVTEMADWMAKLLPL